MKKMNLVLAALLALVAGCDTARSEAVSPPQDVVEEGSATQVALRVEVKPTEHYHFEYWDYAWVRLTANGDTIWGKDESRAPLIAGRPRADKHMVLFSRRVDLSITYDMMVRTGGGQILKCEPDAADPNDYVMDDDGALLVIVCRYPLTPLNAPQ